MADKQTMAQSTPVNTFPREELIRHARAIFGVAPEVVIGALVGVQKAELTVAEVRAAVQAFLRAKPQ